MWRLSYWNYRVKSVYHPTVKFVLIPHVINKNKRKLCRRWRRCTHCNSVINPLQFHSSPYKILFNFQSWNTEPIMEQKLWVLSGAELVETFKRIITIFVNVKKSWNRDTGSVSEIYRLCSFHLWFFGGEIKAGFEDFVIL